MGYSWFENESSMIVLERLVGFDGSTPCNTLQELEDLWIHPNGTEEAIVEGWRLFKWYYVVQS
jgi:hypothetical protein